MAAPDLQGLSAAELQDVIDTATGLLDERKRAEQQKAIEEAEETLRAVGLSFRDVSSRPAKARKAGAAIKAGTRYVNPADANQVYTAGRGRRPKWFAELDAKGQLPAPETAKR